MNTSQSKDEAFYDDHQFQMVDVYKLVALIN